MRTWTWPVVKDLFLTLGGLTVIMWEAFGAETPSDVIVGAGLVLTGLGAGFHAATVIAGLGQPSSSAPSPPPGSSPGSHSPGSPDA